MIAARGIAGVLAACGVTSRLNGLPEGQDMVETCGLGGGPPAKIDSGPLQGWSVGSGERSEVFGSSYPATPPSDTLEFGFIPIADHLGTYPSDTDLHLYYQSLPEDIILPGGDLVEMAITKRYSTGAWSFDHGTFDTPVPFYFVSDNYTAGQVRIALDENCAEVATSDPIRFNSTGNIRLEEVVQFYRGDTAAMLFPDTMPSIPPGGDRVLWSCLNETIGESIPLMNRSYLNGWGRLPGWLVWFICLGALIIFVSFCCIADHYGKRFFEKKDKPLSETEDKSRSNISDISDEICIDMPVENTQTRRHSDSVDRKSFASSPKISLEQFDSSTPHLDYR